MYSIESKELSEQLSMNGKMSFPAGATVEQISAFEEANQLRLPSQYRGWLLFADGGEFYLPAGVQMYGVAHNPLIDVDDTDKPGESYLVIGALATGDPIVCEKGKETISIYNHEAGKIEEDESYPDFFTFLRSLKDILGI